MSSASVLALQREDVEKRACPAKKLIVFVDPVFGSDDQRVIGAQRASSKQRSLRSGTASAAQPKDSSLTRAAEDVSIGEFKRLPMSRREAEHIAVHISKSVVNKAVDFSANLVSATDPELSYYQIVHFATHSILDNRHPEPSESCCRW